ncbi:hypothetical protein [Streptomyces sp. NPDC054784]
MNPLPSDPPRSPTGTVRVPVRVTRPSPVAFAKAVRAFATGATGSAFTRRLRGAAHDPGHDPDRGICSGPSLGVDATTFAPLALRETGAVHVFDAGGLRLEGSAEVSLALTWSEVDRVVPDVRHSPFLGLRMLRLLVWPTHPDTFLAAHPGSAPAWDAERGRCALAVVTAPAVPRDSLDLTLAGLTFAGERFDGRVRESRSDG